MLFNSYEFIFAFLPITFFIYFYLNKKRLTEASIGFLVLASLFFYSWWNIVYLPLILLSILFNYIVGTSLSRESEQKRVSKKLLLTFGIIGNIGLLGYFKYSNFFLENFNGIFGSNIPLPHIILPLGISFFTFTQIAFLVDSYKQEVKEYDLLRYMLFVTFFPHLLAGPILHHKEMMPQFANLKNKAINYRNIALGLFLFSAGLFKKVVIADTFAAWATNGFDKTESLNLLEAWATSLSYTFELYFDFSGYTDMAIGAALLFNIRLPINFDSPYKALNIQDFWRRWHITLSRFLRDYIYIPLGGNRGNSFRTYNNILATFIIGGIWHGAGWTFIFWGFLHGMALVVHRFWSGFNLTMPKVLAWFITFNFVNIAWIFFRAKEWEDALKVLRGMFFGAFILPYEVIEKFPSLSFIHQGDVFAQIDASDDGILWLIGAFIVILAFKNSFYFTQNFVPNIKNALLMYLFFVLSFLHFTRVSEFLYFNF
ncbi:MAG: MBOAT family protein [Sulfurimonas sp.]|jgi:D-alanyl-lipoteichoic acid acyltransferase DltB (MBOAT superfamily)